MRWLDRDCRFFKECSEEKRRLWCEEELCPVFAGKIMKVMQHDLNCPSKSCNTVNDGNFGTMGNCF